MSTGTQQNANITHSQGNVQNTGRPEYDRMLRTTQRYLVIPCPS